MLQIKVAHLSMQWPLQLLNGNVYVYVIHRRDNSPFASVEHYLRMYLR